MWTNIRLDLEESDETVMGSMGNTASVRVTSVASIKPDEGSQKGSCCNGRSLSVAASPVASGLCVLADQQMILFDSTCSEHEATLNLGAQSDCMTWNHTGKFIALADRSGTLHLFHVPSKRLLFSHEIHGQSDDRESPLFACLHFHTCIRQDLFMLVVVTCAGAISLLCDIDLDRLDEAILQSDETAILEIRKNISIQKLYLSLPSEGTFFHSVTIVDETRGVTVVTLADDDHSTISVWSVEQHDGLQLLRSAQTHGVGKLKKCDVTQDCQYLIGLTEEDHLVLFDFMTLVLLKTWKQRAVKNFSVLRHGLVASGADERNSSFAVVAMLTLSDSRNISETSRLLMCSLPNFATELEVVVSSIATLPTVSTDKGILYFIESHEIGSDESGSAVASNGSELIIRSVWEQSPLKRLQHLLDQQEFEKADQLAKFHNLDGEVIQKHRVLQLLAEISQCDLLDSAGIDSFVESISQSLSLIQDDAFVVSCCLGATVHSAGLLMKLLLVVETRLKTAQSFGIQRGSHPECAVLLDKVLTTIKKLTTYHLVRTARFEHSEWQSFQMHSSLDIITHFIQRGDFGAVSVVWRRHEGELMNEITSNSLQTLLDSFPSELQLSSCLPFVEDEMLPLVTTILPSSKVVLASWIKNVIENLEVSDKDHWPENGLRLIDLFLPYVNIPVCQSWQTLGQYADQICASSVCCESSPEYVPVGSLLNLSKHLKELSCLSKTYDMNLTLYEMRKETASTISFRLIDRAIVSGVIVPSLMEKQALPYIEEKKLNKDETILNYIKSLFTHRNAVLSSVSRIGEQKAVGILQYIHDAKVKNLAVTEIVRMASVPISAVIRELVADVLQSPAIHTSDELRRFWSVLEVREVLNKNDVIDCSLSSIPALKLAVCRILHAKSFDALQDALKIVSLFRRRTLSESDVCVQHMYGLLIDGQKDEAMMCLHTMDTVLAVSVASAVLSRLLAVTHYPMVPELGDASFHEHVVQSAKVLLSFLIETDVTEGSVHRWRESHRLVTAMGQLQLEFQTYLSTCDYDNDAVRSELLDQHVEAMFENLTSQNVDQSDGSGTLSVPYSISRFAALLHIRPSHLKQTLARKSIECHNEWLALETCRQLVESVPLTSPAARSVLDVSRNLLANPDRQSDVKPLSSLLESSLISCSEDDIADVLETWKLSDSMCILEKTSKNNLTSTTHILQSGFDDLADVVFGCQFEENETSADCSPTLAAASELCNCLWIPHTHELFPLDHTRLSSVSTQCLSKDNDVSRRVSLLSASLTASSVIAALEACGLDRLAFRIAFQVFGSCVQYYQNNMNSESDGEVEESDDDRQSVAIIRAAHGTLTQLAKKVIDQMLSRVSVEHSEVLSSLLYPPALDFVKEMSEQASLQLSSLLKRFPALQIDLCVLYDLGNMAVKSTAGHACTEWMEFLQDNGVVDHSFVPEETCDKGMLPSLVKASASHLSINIRTIADFCKDFGIDVDTAVRSAVTELLQGHRLDLEALKLELYPVTELLSADAVQAQLVVAYKMLSDTDYENIGFLLSLLDELPEPSDVVTTVAEAKQLLDFVKCYETELPFTADKASQHASTVCLPFRRLMKEPWQVIAPQLSCESFPHLLPIAELLKVDFDRSCSRAIRNTIENIVSVNTGNGVHSDCYSVTNLLMRIENPKTALATGRWAASKFKTGPMKAIAYEVCIKLAEQWRDVSSNTNEPLKTIQKLDPLWRQTKTQVALQEAGVPETVYGSLLQQPASLIVKICEMVTTGRIEDLHDLTNKIGDIYELDCDKIRLHLLERWLDDGGKVVVKDKDDRELVRRLVSLAKGMASPTAFVCWASPNEAQENQLSLVKQVVALKALCASTSREMFEHCLHSSVQEIRDRVCDLLYCQHLLNVVRSPSTFGAYNKLALVRSLWKSQTSSAEGLKLLSGLCLDYGIGDVQLWREILRKLLDYGMMNYLKRLLPALSGHLPQSEHLVLCETWQAAVAAELDAGIPNEKMCIELLQFIQSCPHLLADNLLSTAQCLEEMGQTVEALACLLMSPTLQSKADEFVEQHKEVLIHHLQTHSHSHLPMIQRITCVCGAR